MGVKHLWDIVSPSCERKPLFELHGKTIAIDLSCWVVDSQTVTNNVAQPKMYLRNLYFRTVYLLMQGVSPVFVLEGKAPTLKHAEIARRKDLRNENDKERNSRKGGRGGLNAILKECQKMLSYMGIKCVDGHGEAEAMCAYLNEDGLVDGCISQDSDCFLYGAKTVYRNFCTSAQGNRGGSGGSVDVYSAEKIERLFKLGRKKMIALALLCGCDYDKGVHGVGKEAALKFFQDIDDEDILERMKSWRTARKFKTMESQLKNPDLCNSCGHTGKLRVHTKSGCADCGTVSKCHSFYKERKALMSHEMNLRQKALAIEEFPSEELIEEFLVRKGPMPTTLDLEWKQPKIVEFVNFMVRHVCWEPEYAFAKIFPLATRWQLRHFAPIPREDRLSMRGVMLPEKIKKKRNPKGIASYEIIWKDNDGVLDGLTLGRTSNDENDSDEAESNNDPEELVSIEPQDAVLRCYPELVEEFEAAMEAKKKKPAKPRGKKKQVEAKENDDPNVPVAVTLEPKKRTAARRPRKKAADVNNRKIDEFVKVTSAPSLEDSLEAMAITPKRRKPAALEGCETSKLSRTPKRGPQFDRVLETARISSVLDGTLGRMFDELTPDDFPSESDDYTIMGDVIEELCSQRTTRSADVIDLTLQDFDCEKDDEREMELAAARLCGKSTIKGTTTRGSFEDLMKNFSPLENEDDGEMEEAIERLCSKSTSKRTTLRSLENLVEDDFRDRLDRTSNARNNRSRIFDKHPRSVELHSSDEEAAAYSKKKISGSPDRTDTNIVAASDSFDTSDQFDIVYVPLSQRIQLSKPPNSNRYNGKTQKGFSLGIDDLMCESDS